MKRIWLFGICVLLGCGSNEVVQPANNPSHSGSESSPVARETEEEAVAELEKYGAICTKDASGKVFAVVLEQSDIPDEELTHLKSIPQLRELSLYRTPVTDACVKHLKEIKTLKVVNLEYTKVSREARDELKAALPNCQVVP